MTTRIEAAERLRAIANRVPLTAEEFAEAVSDYAAEACAQRVAAERRATVERIRAAVISTVPLEKHQADALDAILDEEAA